MKRSLVVDPCLLDVSRTIPELVLCFRKSQRVNNILTAATPSHPVPPVQYRLRFTFNQLEVVNALGCDDTHFVVHHGVPVNHTNLRMVRLLDEHLMPFLPKSRGLVYLSRSALADVLFHRIRDWSQLGRDTGAIRLFAHGGHVNKRVLRTSVRRNFGAALATPLELFDSYERLAEAAEACDDCIVLGLRPAFANPERLVPALVDGVPPWAAGEGCGVPHLPVFLGWRGDRPEPYQQIADYLDRVACHLTADTSVLDKIGRSNERNLSERSRGHMALGSQHGAYA